MKKILIVGFLISLNFAMKGYCQNIQAELNVAKENLRAEPNGKKIGELTNESQIVILETRGDWVKIATTGWMWKKSLTELKDQKFYIQASHILVKTKEAAANILKLLLDGSEFADLAKKYSIDPATRETGGDLGVFAKGELLSVFDDAAFKLKPSQISGIVKSNLGYHIIKRTR